MLYGTKLEFKTPELEKELPLIHPNSRGALVELGVYCAFTGLRHPYITDLVRTDDQQIAIYGDNRFSWHKKKTAWDVRVKGGGETRYSLKEANELVKWLKANWPDAEVYLHGQVNTSNNAHIHFAVRLRNA